MWQHLEPVLPQAVAQVTGYAVKKRVPARDDDEFLPGVGLDGAHDFLRIRTDAKAPTGVPRQ
jgi:hypothetical protein